MGHISQSMTTGGGSAEIVSLRRDDVAHSTSRVREIPGVAGDHMNVQMEHGLAGGRPDVNADVESVGLVSAQDLLPRHLNTLQQRNLLFGSGIEPSRNVPTRDDQEVPGRHRESIPQANEPVGLEGDSSVVWLAEEARVGHGTGQESDELGRYWSGSGLPAE